MVSLWLLFSERGKGRVRLGNLIKRLRIVLFYNERAININSIFGKNESRKLTFLIFILPVYFINDVLKELNISEQPEIVHGLYKAVYTCDDKGCCQ